MKLQGREHSKATQEGYLPSLPEAESMQCPVPEQPDPTALGAFLGQDGESVQGKTRWAWHKIPHQAGTGTQTTPSPLLHV